MLVIKYQAMAERSRRIGSIPRTMVDVLRGQTQASVRLGGTSLGIGGLGTGVPRQSRSGREYSFDVRPYVPPKPDRKKSSRPVAPEKERITCQVEIHDNFTDADGGNLGLVMKFSGITFPNASVFKKSIRYSDPDRYRYVFYTPVRYDNGQAFLILSTDGDIFEYQVVPQTKDKVPFFQKDEDRFFQDEFNLTELLPLYDPTSMKPSYNNGLVIVSYKLRPR